MLEIDENRKSAKYSVRENLARIGWGFGWILFRCSPRIFFEYRNWLLRLFGAAVGRHVHIYPSALVYFPWNLSIDDYSSIGEHALIYNLGKCNIGKNVTVSQRAHLCGGTHDYLDPKFTLVKLPVEVRDNAWICADAFVGPGITIGEGAIVGARAVVVSDVEAFCIVAGNPAKFIKRRLSSDCEKE